WRTSACASRPRARSRTSRQRGTPASARPSPLRTPRRPTASSPRDCRRSRAGTPRPRPGGGLRPAPRRRRRRGLRSGAQGVMGCAWILGRGRPPCGAGGLLGEDLGGREGPSQPCARSPPPADAASAGLPFADIVLPVGKMRIHVGQRVLRGGTPLHTARAAVILLHGRGASAEDILSLGELACEDVPCVALLAPQASGGVWYPQRFFAPVEQNEPCLTSAMEVIAGLMRE